MGRTDYIYFLVDVSNSMQGSRIGAVNDAINNILHRLKKVMASREITIKIIMLTFSDSVSWSNVVPTNLMEFQFSDLATGARETKFSCPLKEVNDKLIKQEVVHGEADETTIVLFTDGAMTDDFSESLAELNRNKIFQKANRVAFVFDSPAKMVATDNLNDFISDERNMVVEDFVLLNKMLFEKYR